MFDESQILEFAVLAQEAPFPCGSREVELLVAGSGMDLAPGAVHGQGEAGKVLHLLSPSKPGRNRSKSHRGRERDSNIHPWSPRDALGEELDCALSPACSGHCQTLVRTEGVKSWAEWLQPNRHQNDPKCRKWKGFREEFVCSECPGSGDSWKANSLGCLQQAAIGVFILVCTQALFKTSPASTLGVIKSLFISSSLITLVFR